ncbi:MAG: hypothetical protein KDA60_00635 [Planctomycetales bacterium]|nr:hypothetical protein [Planctomycetales bacterium]
MGMVIANNVPSLTAQHHLNRSSDGLRRSLERLSSGLKVNRGADNPAALVISEKQRAQIAGLNKAIENTEKAISMVQTAEGALNEINSLLVKIRSLALDSANTGVNDSDALEANQSEIDNALETINRIANNTQFGRKQLLDGSAGISGEPNTDDITLHSVDVETEVGTYSVVVSTPAERATVDSPTAQTQPLAADEQLTINNVSIQLAVGLTQTEVIEQINEYTGQTGVIADANGAGGATRLYSVSFGSSVDINVVSNRAGAADSTGIGTTIMTDTGVDVVGTIGGIAFEGRGKVASAVSGAAAGVVLSFAADTGANAHLTVSSNVGSVTVTDSSLTFQIGPNQFQSATVAIDRVNPSFLGLDVTNNEFKSLAEIDVLSADTAAEAIGIVDRAIDTVTGIRGLLGAFQQNTLEATANNLRATLENTVNADSVIRDTDFAEEIANFTKNQVLVQAGTSVLSSANQTSELVLSLLG